MSTDEIGQMVADCARAPRNAGRSRVRRRADPRQLSLLAGSVPEPHHQSSSNSSRLSTPQSSTTKSSSTAPKPPWTNSRRANAPPRTGLSSKRRLLAHTLQQIGLKTLRTPTSTLPLAEASLKAIAVAPEDIPARWWKLIFAQEHGAGLEAWQTRTRREDSDSVNLGSNPGPH